MGEKLFTGNFVLLIMGQITSLFGNYILRLALSMYVLEETGSPPYLPAFYLRQRFRPSFCLPLAESLPTVGTEGISWWRWML